MPSGDASRPGIALAACSCAFSCVPPTSSCNRAGRAASHGGANAPPQRESSAAPDGMTFVVSWRPAPPKGRASAPLRDPSRGRANAGPARQLVREWRARSRSGLSFFALIAFSDGKPVSTFPENAQAARGNKKPARRVPAGAIRPIAFRHLHDPMNIVKRLFRSRTGPR
jgi:hypothetical protein